MSVFCGKTSSGGLNLALSFLNLSRITWLGVQGSGLRVSFLSSDVLHIVGRMKSDLRGSFMITSEPAWGNCRQPGEAISEEIQRKGSCKPKSTCAPNALWLGTGQKQRCLAVSARNTSGLWVLMSEDTSKVWHPIAQDRLYRFEPFNSVLSMWAVKIFFVRSGLIWACLGK